MKLFGITETYDPCFVKDWDKRLQPEANIIITKELTDEMIDIILENQHRVILHHTITGLGGTCWEPGVKACTHEIHQAFKLFDKGFPIQQYVLRHDPICWFLAETQMQATQMVFTTMRSLCERNGVSHKIRCRISMCDVYNHVKERLKELTNEEWPDTLSFHAPLSVFEVYNQYFIKETDLFSFESCAENGKVQFGDFVKQIGCVSPMDLSVLRIDSNDYTWPTDKQRPTCLCMAKKQILNIKPGQCPHRCVYCFWKTNC